ncbi:MAG: protease modulator HflC [Methylobacteriaceae bacterium]|nr:protease modulator HflC [Methylobacteriaceae bacterium]
MKNGIGGLIGVVLLIAALFIGANSLFVVHQTESALVLRFGSPVANRGVIKTPGLHFKAPFIESVQRIDNRILDLESPKQEVLASDNQRIEVDAFVRYRITDPLLFYQTVGTVRRADNQLASVLNSALRRVLGEATLVDIVRESRASLMVKIRELVNAEGARLGVAAIDVRIRRADLPKEISEKVYSRMQTERQREAAEFRAQGAEQAAKITAKADADVTILRGEAVQQADQIRGEGEAERNRVFAEAFGKDPGFFAFWRSMQAYEAGLRAGDTRMILSPNSEFFRFFGDPAGRAEAGAGAPSFRAPTQQ